LSGVSGDGTANVTFSGNLADLNAALDGLTFTPTPAYGGPANILVSTSDLGNNGAGGAGVAADTLNIAVTGNSAPIVVTTGSALAYTEQAGAATIDGNLTVSDADTPLLDHAVVRVAVGYVSGQDVLEFSDQLGITGSCVVGCWVCFGGFSVGGAGCLLERPAPPMLNVPRGGFFGYTGLAISGTPAVRRFAARRFS